MKLTSWFRSRPAPISTPDLEEQVRRGHHASQLLADDLLAEIFDTTHEGLMQAWHNSPARDVEGRETLWLSVTLLAQIKQRLISAVETGQMAADDLSRRGLSAPR